jgi:hypothetical protein
MKKIYLSILAIAAFSKMNAQLTLTKAANEPVSGDVQVNRGYDSTTAVPKNGGSGISWNFTSMTASNFTQTSTYTTASSVPAGSLFPSCNLAALRGGTETDFFKTTGNDWEFGGNYDSGGPGNVLSLTNTAVFASWPASFGSSNTDNISGTETSGTTTANWNGSITYTVSGSGTVIVPGGQTFTNCLQLVMSISLTITQGTNTTTEAHKQYLYFAPSKKFPIAEMEYKSQTSGTTTSTNFNAFFDNAVLPVNVNENNPEAEFSIYPNPAKDFIHIINSARTMIDEVEVIDVTGKTVLKLSQTDRVDVSTLQSSLYLIKLHEGNSISVKRMIIEH